VRDGAGPSLEALRRRVQEASDPRALARLLRALRADERAGARALAERLELRLAAARRERRRLAALFALRRRLVREGAHWVAGVDEVGMGPLAGPIVAVAVVLPERVDLPGLDDSKRLAAPVRERLDRAIREQALALSLAEVWPEEIDRRNVYRAGLEALRRAVFGLPAVPDHVLVDGRGIPDLTLPQTPMVKGDRRDGSIAAASIVAKVHRDAIMVRLDREFPDYGFAEHKGYATAAHLQALRRAGPCPLHRRSFAPVAQLTLL
jgi:ribonuclease HII